MALKEIPANDVPFSLKQYSRIDDELRASQAAFARLGYQDIHLAFERARAELNRAWAKIGTTESLGL